MKNFFKKLSFVLASAMVITSLYAPANTSAAAKDGIILKGKAVTKKGIFVGGEKVNFDYKIGKHNNKGANGKWSVSDTSVITVDKHGKVTAVGTGDATLYLKVKKNAKKGIKKNLTFKVKLNAMARADKLTIPASDKAITLKVGEVKDIMPVLTDKVEGVKNTYNLFAKSSDDSVATAKAENGKVVVEAKMATSSAVTVTVFAAQKNSAEEAMNNKYKVEDSFTVTVKGDFSAKQKASNKIVVMGKELTTDAAAYVVSSVKNKDVKLTIKSVEVNADKTEAVLLGDTIQFPEGDYVVTFKENKADITIEKAMSARFEITPADKAVAVLSGNKYTTAYVYYKVFDQFDNDITGTSLVNVQINGSHSPAAASNDRTKIVFKESNGFQIGLSKVTLNLYDLSNTKKSVSLSAVLDVTNEARVSEGTFVGLFDKDTNKMIESVDDMTDFTKKNIYALFNFKDQYGNEVHETTNLKNEIFVAATGLTGVIVSATAEKVENKVTKKEYVGFKLAKQSGVTELRQGEVELRTTIFANAAKSFTDKFQVTATPKVHDLSVYVGAKGFYAGQENELGFSALDQNGKAVTDIKVLKKVKWSDTNLKFVEEKGKAILKYDASLISVSGTSETASQPVFFVATTETNAIKQFNLTLSKKKMVNEFLGLKDGTPLVVTSSNELVLKLDTLDIRDQYGNPLAVKDIATDSNPYKLTVDVVNGSSASFENSSANPVPANVGTADEFPLNVANAKTESSMKSALKVKASAGMAGDSTVTFTLKDHTGKVITEAKEYTISNAALKDVEDIKVEKLAFDDETVQPASDLYHTAAGNGPKVTVTGTYKGRKVSLVAGTDFTVNGVATAEVTVPAKDTIEKGKTTAENKAIVTILTGNKVLEHKYTYTNVPRHVAEIAVAKDKQDALDKEKRVLVDLSNGTNALSYDSAYAAGKIISFVELKDQYKRTFDNTNEKTNENDKYYAQPIVVFSNYDTNVAVTQNGTKDAALTVTGAINTEYNVDVTLIYPITNKSVTLHLKVKKIS